MDLSLRRVQAVKRYLVSQGVADSRLAVVAVNTMLASATGAFSAYLYVKIKYGKADPSWLANGMLAGLVAITAPCAFVSSWAAMLIGAIAGVLVILAGAWNEVRSMITGYWRVPR